MKRMKAFLAALLLSVAGITSLNIGQALAATCTWTGATSDNFNTSTNWSGCGSGVPQTGDNITFDATSLTADKTLTNNISGLSVATITFTGTNSGSYRHTITGNAITITGGVVANASANLGVDVTLGASQTWSGSSYLIVGNVDTPKTLAMGAYNLTLNANGVSFYSVLTGSGNLVVSKDAWMMESSPAWTGNVSVAATAQASIESPNSFGSTGTITVANGGTLSLCGLKGGTVQNPISVAGEGNGSGGAIASAASCGGMGTAGDGKAVLAGAITLTGNTVVNAAEELKITGALSGDYTITLKSGANGSLVIASSNNTSKTPNGTSEAKEETITIDDDQPNTFVSVGRNQTYIIKGIRGTTYVAEGGILKGTGTVGDLTVYGKVAPGLSPGCLNTGALALLPTATYEFEVGGTTACSGYDQLKVTGTVDVHGKITVTPVNGFKPVKGQVYTIIDNDGSDAVINAFTDLAEGATFTSNGYVLKISYVGGSGNDVTLTVMNVPASPDTGFAMIQANPLASMLAMGSAGGALLFLARRMRPVKVKAKSKASTRTRRR